MHFLHHVLSGIPAVFLFQHFIRPLKNCSNQSHLLKHISDIITLYSKSVTDFTLYIWSKSWLFLPLTKSYRLKHYLLSNLIQSTLLQPCFFLMPLTTYLLNSETFWPYSFCVCLVCFSPGFHMAGDFKASMSSFKYFSCFLIN